MTTTAPLARRLPHFSSRRLAACQSSHQAIGSRRQGDVELEVGIVLLASVAEADLEGIPPASPPVPAYVEVWRSVRSGGDTKTRKSRRTLALPSRAVDALRRQRIDQAELRLKAGERWIGHGLVFPCKVGTPMDRNNALRAFRLALANVSNLDPKEWSPRELRHSFVSLLSDSGVSIEDISRSSGTAARASPSSATATRSGPFSRPARSRWTPSSGPGMRIHSHSDSHSGMAKALHPMWVKGL